MEVPVIAFEIGCGHEVLGGRFFFFLYDVRELEVKAHRTTATTAGFSVMLLRSWHPTTSFRLPKATEVETVLFFLTTQ